MPARRRSASRRASAWGGRKAQSIRARLLPLVEAGDPCPFCGLPLHPSIPWDVDHGIPIDADPSAMWDTTHLRPAHSSCNRRAGQLIAAKKRARTVLPRRPTQLCAGCAVVWVDPADWLCRDCRLVVAGA